MTIAEYGMENGHIGKRCDKIKCAIKRFNSFILSGILYSMSCLDKVVNSGDKSARLQFRSEIPLNRKVLHSN